MTATVTGSSRKPDPDAPRVKTPMPPLDARAARPSGVRLRRGVVVGLVMAGAGLVGAALAWAFVVQPNLRAHAAADRKEQPTELRGDVRPSERLTKAPASYGQLDQLPEPRSLRPDQKRVDGTSSLRPAVRSSAPQSPPAHSRSGDIATEATKSGLFFAGDGEKSAGQDEAGSKVQRGDYAAVYNGHALLTPLSPYEVKAGSVIPAAMITAIDTSRAGPVVATVTENVFDTVSGRRLLIPQGARLIGNHEGEGQYGDSRAVIAWDRLILPNGKSLVLSREPGVDAQGAVGVKGDVDRRLLPLAVATLFSGAITTLGQAARDRDDNSGGLLGDAGDAASIQAAQIGGKLIDRELQVRPVIRLRPGARVRVLITRDLILEPYEP
jgi:type IV secretion system protein VirB10